MKVIGISGSPVVNSNTDRLIKEVLESSNLDYEFVKLSKLNVRPCLGCKACVEDNLCKVNDDFIELSKKLKEADALVIGAYTPYRMIDGFTKSFLERLWSMRHVHSLNEGKYAVSIVSGLNEEIVNKVQEDLSVEFSMERMNHVASLNISGNVPCLTCGRGQDCKNSGAIKMFGENAIINSDLCIDVENQKVFEQVSQVGKKLGECVRANKCTI